MIRPIAVAISISVEHPATRAAPIGGLALLTETCLAELLAAYYRQHGSLTKASHSSRRSPGHAGGASPPTNYGAGSRPVSRK